MAKSTTKKAAPKKAIKKASSATNSSGSTEPALLELFIDEIKDIYWAEKALTKALPKMQKAATTQQLKDAIATHTEQTTEHVARLEQIFELLGQKAQAKKCEAMAGLTEEGNSVIEDTDKGTATRDVGIIIASQKIEHYEIATYGSLKTLAATLGKDDIADILAQTLEEEKQTDELLTGIAENDINYQSSTEEE